MTDPFLDPTKMPAEAPTTATFAPPPPARRPRLLSRLMLAVTLLLGLWIGWQEAPREVGRWYFAAAVEHRVNADYFRIIGRQQASQPEREQAEAAMKNAIAWYPDSAEIYLERARWREQDSQYEGALADCDAAVRFGVNELIVAQRKAGLLMHLGKPGEAVKEAEKIETFTRRSWNAQDDSEGLNARAYFRSLAKEKLSEALADIDAALVRVSSNRERAIMLDTRGFVLYQMGRYDEAMSVFKTALPLADAEVSLLRSGRRLPRIFDRREIAIENHRELESMAVIYFHGSLVLEKLNRWKEASQLRSRAKELLGREPDDSLF